VSSFENVRAAQSTQMHGQTKSIAKNALQRSFSRFTLAILAAIGSAVPSSERVSGAEAASSTALSTSRRTTRSRQVTYRIPSDKVSGPCCTSMLKSDHLVEARRGRQKWRVGRRNDELIKKKMQAWHTHIALTAEGLLPTPALHPPML